MAAPGGWAHFRKVWIKPEVYPLIGSMVVAVGVCGAALANKISQPGMTFSKAARAGGIHAQFEGIDEVKPMWSGSSKYSASIFNKSHEIMENKLAAPVLAEAAAEAKEELEILTEAPAEVVGAAVETIVEQIEEEEETVKEVAEDVKSSIEHLVTEDTTASTAEESEEKMLEKGAEVVAELKKIVPEPPSATA